MHLQWRIRALTCLFSLAGTLLLGGCQALGGGDSVATIGADLTKMALEIDAIRAAATAERNMAIETVAAASTRVAELSVVNAALGATLRANHTHTPALSAVVVSAADMGRSLGADMMDDADASGSSVDVLRVTELSTAAGVNRNSGCSSGAQAAFSPASERIYVTARVNALSAGTTFRVDWLRDSVLLVSISWQADYSKPVECIWFYATPEDFAFAQGNYRATMFVDGLEIGSAEFDILAS